jgi:hypothetical protein
VTVLDVRRDGAAVVAVGQSVVRLVGGYRRRRVQIAEQAVERPVLEHYDDRVIERVECGASQPERRRRRIFTEASA